MDYESEITQAMNKLPPHVLEWVDSNVEFLDRANNPHSGYYAMIMPVARSWIIDLSEDLIKLPKILRIAVIGHEFAHAWLGHKLNHMTVKQEREADNQAKAWGFRIAELRK